MDEQIKQNLANGKAVLGIELGSTRIKAVAILDDGTVAATGVYEWENRYVDGVWTYDLSQIEEGLSGCYLSLKQTIRDTYGITVKRFGAMGISAMMHGYIALDEKDNFLTGFRTWRNTMTAAASEALTRYFHYPIPQRWSIAHLYQAIADNEAHVGRIKHLMTLAVYIHYRLTGECVAGIGEASGMFPIDPQAMDYDKKCIFQFDKLVASRNYPWKLGELLPQVLTAGADAGSLTKEGAEFLDPEGDLMPGIVFCPPEGDAGTGMVATNSVRERTGNVSAGTSVFSMVVLEKPLREVYEEIDVVATPDGLPVAMVHCNNCTSELNRWMKLFGEVLQTFGREASPEELYGRLFGKAKEGAADGGGLLAYNYLSGEHIVGLGEGRPLVIGRPECEMSLADFMRVQIMSAFATLKLGNDILLKKENVRVDRLYGHGGIFKTPEVAQRLLSAAMHTEVAVMDNAGEGGAWGIALLAAYRIGRKEGETLADYLENRIFAGSGGKGIMASEEETAGFDAFAERFRKGLEIENAAVRCMTR